MLLKKYLKTSLIILLLVALVFTTRYGYKKYKKYVDEYQFNKILTQAAKIDLSSWFDKYKAVQVKDTYKAVIVTSNGGEYSYSEYFKYAAERLGWQVIVYQKQVTGYEKEILAFDPDFIIFATDAKIYNDMKITAHRSKKYLLNFVPFATLKSQKKVSDSDPCSLVKDQDFAYLLPAMHGVITTTKEVDIFKCMFNKNNKPFNGFNLLPLVYQTDYAPAELNNLMWVGMGWDNFRSSGNYKKFISLLSENIPMKTYGSYMNFSYLKPGIYDGFVSPGVENIEAIRKNGIYLLTHSDMHIAASNPSVRLFEAVAANAVVISDMNPFAIEHFGNSFLYFDQTASSEAMYAQVKSHYDWIKANPEKAKAMANRAHNIFLEKFTLEKDLNKIAKMHEYILNQEKGTSYPFGF